MCYVIYHVCRSIVYDIIVASLGRPDDTVGNPHRAQISQFELFELILLLQLDKRFSIERFEPTVSQSAVPSPPLRRPRWTTAAGTCTNFRGIDSSIILIVRGGILMSIGSFPESLSQAILAGRFLVGRLGVLGGPVGQLPL